MQKFTKIFAFTLTALLLNVAAFANNDETRLPLNGKSQEPRPLFLPVVQKELISQGIDTKTPENTASVNNTKEVKQAQARVKTQNDR